MFRTFLIGIVLGLAAAAGALYAIPVVDQHREASIVAVAPNGGNAESFHINIPMDRVVVGAPGDAEPLPPGLEWPEVEVLNGVRTELFKLRNTNDVVVGVAVRTAIQRDSGSVIDWALHLPARGSLFIGMESVPREGGFRMGQIRLGSREFADLSGVLTERWAADSSEEEDAPLGRIELRATYIGQFQLREDEEVPQ